MLVTDTQIKFNNYKAYTHPVSTSKGTLFWLRLSEKYEFSLHFTRGERLGIELRSFAPKLHPHPFLFSSLRQGLAESISCPSWTCSCHPRVLPFHHRDQLRLHSLNVQEIERLISIHNKKTITSASLKVSTVNIFSALLLKLPKF